MIQGEAEERERVQAQNDIALFGIMARYDILIPPSQLSSWRPTQKSFGHIPGVKEYIRILCTDGVVAWFVREATAALTMGGVFYPEIPQELLFGHVSHFTGEVKPLFSIMPKHKEKPPKTPKAAGSARGSSLKSSSKPKASVDAALALLISMTKPPTNKN